MSEYVPQSEDERQKLEQGYVRYQGKWLSKPAYEDQLRKEFEQSKARADELAKHADFHNAWEQETRHFVVRTNSSPELLEYYCELLEAYYGLMDDRFKINPSPSLRRTKMEVNIWKSRAEFYKANRSTIPPGVAGFFMPIVGSLGGSLNFYHDYQEPAISNWVSLHECTHLLTYLIDPQYVPQIWLNEAVADFFGSSKIERDAKGKLRIVPGQLQTDRVLTVQQAIQDEKAVALRDLFLIERDDFSAFEYAHAWSFVYFLNESSPERRKAFDRVFKDIYTLKKGILTETVPHFDKSGTGKRVPPEEIRRVVLDALATKDVEALDREWKQFIAGIPVEGPGARFKRGWMSIIQGSVFDEDEAKMKAKLAAAKADLDAAIEAGFPDARAWWARSQVLQLQGQEDAAKKDLQSAIERDPLNAGYRYELGSMLVGGAVILSGMGIDIEIEDSDRKGYEEVPEAQEHLGLAMELAPDNPVYRRTYEQYMDH
jgi:tetratricopeptide (TPR) repeat protein